MPEIFINGQSVQAEREQSVLQAALALELTGRASSAMEAAYAASTALDDGAGVRLLERLKTFSEKRSAAGGSG